MTTTLSHVVPRADVGPNLPLTRFIGRGNELSVLVARTADTRLLSLIGPGGSGKTRLARAVREQLSAAGQPTWWVGLAQVDCGALLTPAVAEALGVVDIPGRSLVDLVAARLREHGGVLLLDNCEHLVEDCAALVGQLLRTCPDLRVMTTSREPLAVAGETTWWVDGLSLPAELPAPVAADLAGSEAVQLFIDRARLVRHDFALTDANAADVARLCRRLDGMPLALELAAARLRVLPLPRIVERLDDACALLVTTNRDAVPRHATLRATLDWSYELLPEAERDMFARLSVFRGGFTLEAAAAVIADGDEGLALDLLARLVDKSLVQVHADGGEGRYRLLEVVRQYADERLGDRHPDIAARHARYVADLAEWAEQGLGGPAQQLWMDRLHRDQDNLRAALAWACRHDVTVAVRLAAALGRYYRLRGQYGEGRQWLNAAASVADDRTPPAIHAKVLAGLGTLEFLQCEYGTATARLDRALQLYTSVDDSRGIAAALQSLASIAREQGRYAQAREHHERCLTLWRRLDEPVGVARALKALGFTAWLEGDYRRTLELSADALHRFRDLGDSEGAIGALVDLGAATYRHGDPAAARPLLNEALVLAARLNFGEATAWAKEQLGLIAAADGDRHEAIVLLRESLTVHHELGDRWRTASTLDALAGLIDAATGARLLAAAERVRSSIGTPVPPCDRPEHGRRVREIRDSLGDDGFARATADGRALSLDRAVATAVAAAEACVHAAATAGTPSAVPPPAVTPPAVTSAATPVAGQVPVSATPARLSVGEPPPELRVQALGRVRVRVAGRVLGPEDWTYAKPRELLLYLLTRPGAGKAEIGLALWPDASGAELRNSLHTCLKFLRRAVGANRVRFAQGGYHVDETSPLHYDVAAFVSAAASAREPRPAAEAIAALIDAAGHYPGDYLIDVAVGQWAERHRDNLRRRYEQVMLTLGTLLARERRFAEAADTFARLIEHDPLLEAAHRGLMRCHAAQGNRGRAVRQYDELARVLHHQLGVPPAPETAALHSRLRAAPPVASPR